MRYFSAFLLGFLLLLCASFVLFTGIYAGYFKFYGINEYFNLIFIYSQPWLVLALLALPVGLLVLEYKAARAFYALVLCVFAFSWQGEFGLWLGHRLFSSHTELQDATLLYSIQDRSYYLTGDKRLIIKKR